MANRFESEIQESAKYLGLYYHKLAVSRGGSWKRDSPFDSFIIRNGVFIAVEMKSQKLLGSFNLSRITPNQEHELLRVIEHGGQAYLFLNMRKPENKAWALDMRRWVEIRQRLESVDRKSIPRDMLQDSSVFVPIPRKVDIISESSERVNYWDIGILFTSS